MNRKQALSGLGYTIVLVIILGIVMIVSAPMLANKYGTDKNDEVHAPQQQSAYEPRSQDMSGELERLSSRVNELENAIGGSRVSDKYVCEIKGYVDSRGNELPPHQRDYASKFIFSCEYRR